MVSGVRPWYNMALRYQFCGFGMGRDDEQAHHALGHGACIATNAGPPHGAHVWLANGDSEGWSLLVQMQAGIDLRLYCLVPDTICRRV